jgi:Mg2+-importing ATPase
MVIETGLRTAFGAIAARLRARQPETDFGRGARQVGYLLIRAMVVIVLFVLIVNLLLGRPVIESVLFAVALEIGLSPELFPAIVSVTLTEGTIVLNDALDAGNRPSDEVRRLAFLNAAFRSRDRKIHSMPRSWPRAGALA